MSNQFERRIESKEIGIRLLGKFLFDTHNRIIQVMDKNRGLHKVIKTEQGNKYYYIFKNAPFFQGDKFYSGYAGYWETINLECLEYCLNHNIDLILIGYPSGAIYKITPKEWKKEAEKHNSTRTIPDGRMLKEAGKLKLIDEIVVSIPLHSLQRFN
jgi:hypothetical protein